MNQRKLLDADAGRLVDPARGALESTMLPSVLNAGLRGVQPTETRIARPIAGTLRSKDMKLS